MGVKVKEVFKLRTQTIENIYWMRTKQVQITRSAQRWVVPCILDASLPSLYSPTKKPLRMETVSVALDLGNKNPRSADAA
jgi:hypothetical protein